VRFKKTLIAVTACVVMVTISIAAASSRAQGPHFQLKWQSDFTQAAPLGSFSGCDHNADSNNSTSYCSGLPSSLQSQWWAYPSSWPDTAESGQLGHFSVGGHYDPAQTVWISGGQMHIRMFRGTSGVHSAAVVPKAAMGMKYGEFTETFEVSKVAAGYKSAHLLLPTGNAAYEIDFPENSWDKTFCAFDHHPDGSKNSYCPADATWTSWHTTKIVWMPGSASFYLDGKLIGKSLTSPDVPMEWVIQNESSTDGESAAANSSAQINISNVAVYSYVP
jgi:hypothetical protein